MSTTDGGIEHPSAALPFDARRQPVEARQYHPMPNEEQSMSENVRPESPEHHLTRMREALIAARWAWAADDPDGALEHELKASIALQQALDTLKERT